MFMKFLLYSKMNIMKISSSNVSDVNDHDDEDTDANLGMEDRILKLLASKPAPVSDQVLLTWKRLGPVTLEHIEDAM